MKSLGTKKLLGVAVAAALGLGVAGNAQAAAYAVAIDDVMNFLVSTTGGVALSGQSTVSETSATHTGFPGMANSAPLDALQSTAGPGPFPPENTFTPQGQTGDYARGDAQIRNANVLGGVGSAINIAEVYDQDGGLGTGFGANTLTGTIVVDANGGNIGFSFDALPYMEVQVGGSGVYATSQLAFNISIEDAATNQTIFDWNPDGVSGNDGIGNDVENGASLNETLTAFAGQLLYHNQAGILGNYSNFIALSAGTYNLTVGMVERASAETPEPATLLLLGAGLAGLGYTRRQGKMAVAQA